MEWQKETLQVQSNITYIRLSLRVLEIIGSQKTLQSDEGTEILANLEQNIRRYEKEFIILATKIAQLETSSQRIRSQLVNSNNLSIDQTKDLHHQALHVEHSLTSLEQNNTALATELHNLIFNLMVNLETANPDLYQYYLDELNKIRREVAQNDFRTRLPDVSYLLFP